MKVVQYVMWATMMICVGLAAAVWAVHAPALYWSTEGYTTLQTIWPIEVYVRGETFKVIAWVYGLTGWSAYHCFWMIRTNRI